MSTSSRIIDATNSTATTTNRSLLLALLGAVTFTGLTIIGANIRIPLQPVPITLQTLFVLLSGAMIGSRFGSFSQFLYVGLGVMGVPIFAGSTAGFGVVVGPTGGYLLGFLVAPMLIGSLIRRRASVWWSLLVMYLGSLSILGLGVLHLTVFYTHNLRESLAVGYLPFIPGDILKILAAVSIYRSFTAFRAQRKNK